MGNLTLNGATSGQITLAPTAVAGTNTLTLPASTGTVALTNTAVFNSATTLSLQTGGTTGLYIDASQNVGIGTTSPVGKLDVVSAAQDQLSVRSNSTTAGSSILVSSGNGTTSNNYSYIQYQNAQTSAYNWKVGTFGSNSFSFYDATAAAERMRLDTSGKLLVGVTSNAGASGGDITAQRGASQGVLWLSTVGSLDYGVTNSNFSFKNGLGGGYSDIYYQVAHPASDQIWKENVKDISYGLTEVLQLKPRDFTWIESKKESIGFIAQEIQPIIPKIVSADRDGHLSVEYDKIVAVLTKAIQELSAKVTALEAKVGA